MRIDAAGDQAVDIAGHAQHAVRVRAAQVRLDVGIGHQPGVGFVHAAGGVNAPDEGVELGIGDADMFG